VKSGLLAFFIILSCPFGGSQQRASRPSTSSSESNRDWVLTWSDEFNGPDGESPDSTKWIVEAGGNGWGNNELEYYTPSRHNVRLENRRLVIEAEKEQFTGTDGVKRDYTSARLKTQGRFSQAYGRFEARIQVPKGPGVWPAFWLLGEDFSTTGWPECGEIDIMENVGGEPTTIHGTIHGPGYSGDKALTERFILPQGQFSDDFHIFSVEWEPQVIRFYVDDRRYATRTARDLPAGARWVFDHPFFVVLNLAIGGDMPGSPDSTTVFPQRMLVDYVRVYSRK
jgi:beta-glucanase (GH16 family)